MLPIRLRVRPLDHDGFNGRDHFAKDSDVGSLVTPLKMEAVWYHENGDYNDELLNDKAKDVYYHRQDYENHVCMWTCVTDDGRIVELMDHEIEVEIGERCTSPCVDNYCPLHGIKAKGGR